MVVVKEGPYYRAEQAALTQANGSSSTTTSNGTSSSVTTPVTVNTSNMEPKQEYNYIENKCAQEAETAGYLEILRKRIAELENGKLENDHVTLLLTSAIPKITKTLLKHRFMDDDLCANVQNFFKRVLDLVASYIQSGAIASYQSLIAAMTYIFDNDHNYYLSKGKPNTSMEEQDQFAVFPHSNKWASYWLVELVEYFGRRGGYDIILDYLKSLTVPPQPNENSTTGNNTTPQPIKSSLPLVIGLLEPLWNIIHNGYYTPEVLTSQLEKIQAIVLPYMMNVSNDELKQFKKDELDALFKLMSKMLEAMYPLPQVGEIMEKFQLEFALKCFLSPIFDKRIYGLGYINEVIGLLRGHPSKEQASTPRDTDNATSHAIVVYQPPQAPPLPKDTKWIDAPFLVNFLQRNQLVELIFGKSAQPVILQKSGDILAFLGKNDALTRDQIDMIWKCATTVHEAFLPILFKVLGDNCGELQAGHIQQLYECLQGLPRNTLTSIYLQLLRDFSKGAADPDQRLMCMNLLYDIMVDQTPSTGPPVEISQLAMIYLSDLVKQTTFRPHRHAWLAKCIQNIRQNISVAFCLDIMGQIFSSYPPKPPSKDHLTGNNSTGSNNSTNAPLAGTADGASTSNNNGTTSQAVENVSVVDIIKKIEKEFNFFDLFFEELVNFKNIAIANVAPINREQFDVNILVLAGRLDFISEVRTRLRLLLFVLNHYETVLDHEKYEIVWDNMIVRAITYAEYDECFQWFINARVEPYANSLVAIDDKNAALLFRNKMMKINPAGMSSLAFKCVQRYFLDANIKDKKIEWKDIKDEDFEVQDLDLIGYSFLWDILLNVYNLDVFTACSEFLIKIQTKISPKVVEQAGKKKLREQFVTLCLNYLQRSAEGISKVASDGSALDVERRIERCLSLLIAFCDQAQVETGYKIKSHGTSTRGKPIKLLFLNSVLNSYPAAFSVSTHTNEQVSTIKARVKDIINYQGPLKHLYFSIQRVTIPLADESKTLHDLKIHSTASSFDYSRHSSDSANVYPNNRYVITVHEIPHLPKGEETNNRSRAGNGSPKVDKKDPADAGDKAKQLMEVAGITETAALVALRRSDWDINAGVLLLTDEAQRKEILEEAEKLSEEASAENAKATIVDEKVLQELPSYILSYSEEFFSQIFKLLNLNNESISNKVWHLLLCMPTSKSMLETIHAIGREDSRIDWDSLLDIKSSYKLLYILQIIDTTIFAVEEALTTDFRVKWCNQFLAKGGFLQLYKILSSQDWFAPPKLSQSQEKSGNEAAIQQKSCLALILKILDFFLHAIIDKGLDYRNNDDPFVIQIKNSHAVFSGMLEHIDIASTIEKLLLIVWNCASKAVPDVDDAVVSYAMRLVVLLILSDPSKLSVLYNYKSFDTFVLRTILECREFSIRSAAAEGFYQLCAHIVVPNGKVPTPHSYFLKLLLNNMPDHMSTNYAVWGTCGQYFHLLDRLIDDACSGKDGENPKKYQDFLLQLVQFLKQRPIVEMRNSDVVDEILIGLLCIITTLVRHEPAFRHLVGQQHGLVQELYHNGLFGLKAGPSSSSPPKCKARLSRLHAFQLLIELGKNEENYAQMLGLLESHHSGGTRVSTWEYHPSADDKPTNGYVGLRNLGNTCYINSLFQQFFMMPSVRDGFLKIEEPTTDKEKKESLAYQIQNIFGYLQESEKASFDPAGFCASYKDWEGRPTNVHQQQDVDEFFKILWQRLEGQLKNTPHEKLLTSVFGGKMCTELKSVEKDYPYVSEREEDFITLSLDIKGKPNIEAALDAFVKADKLEGDNAYYCEQYQRKVDATTRCYIKKLTNTVILHLKRFDFDFTSYKKNKVNDYCEFPLFLNMKPWTKDGISQKEAGEMTDNTDPEYAYELMGVLVHSGGADAGHYYSYIKERNAKFGERKWFEFNDKVVSDFDIKGGFEVVVDSNRIDLAGECFGGTQLVTHWDNWSRQYVKRTYDRVRSAYMLFYDRVKIDNTSQEPKIDSTIINGIASAANQSQSEPNYINGVPYNIYKSVWAENAEFLRDRQLFDPTYFDFMLQLSKLANVTPVTDYNVDPNSLTDDVTLRAIKLGTHFVFETLAHAKESDNYFHWIEQLKSLYQIHVPACKWLLNHLMHGSLLHDLLLECPIEKIRYGAADLIGHVLKTLAPFEHAFYNDIEEALKVTAADGAISIAPVGSVPEGPDAPKTELIKVPKPLTVRFMDNVFALLEESRNYWRRFKQYFKVIRDFALISHYQRQYLISRQIISLYTEYFMGKTKKNQTKRANVMDRFNLPDLVEFIETISIVVRGCETGALKEKGYPPTTINDGVVLTLPNREKKELWDKTFFTSMLEMDYNTKGALEIIVHSSWEDLKRTKWVMDLLLGEISKSWMSDKFSVFEALLTPMILLADSLQNTRIIMALSPFGSPGSPKGVLAIIHELHAQNAKYVLMLIKFLMHLSTDPAVASYLSKQAREMMWIEQFLESKVGNAATGGADEEMGTMEDAETVDVEGTPLNGDPEIIEYGPHLPGQNPLSNGTRADRSETRPRRDSIYLSYVTVKKFLQEHGVQQEPNFDKERELVEEIDALKRENARLKEALEYYRQKAPEVKPPGFMTTKEWEQGRSSNGGKVRIDEDDRDDESRMDDSENQMEMETISTAVVTTVVTTSQPRGESQLPPEIQEKVAQLTAIFTNVPEQIAILALKKMDNDVDNAAFLLSDDISLTDLMKEASEADETSNPNKKQKTSSPDDSKVSNVVSLL